MVTIPYLAWEEARSQDGREGMDEESLMQEDES